MASTMFLVPSDITVVGPDEHRIIYFMYNIFPFGKLCVSSNYSQSLGDSLNHGGVGL